MNFGECAKSAFRNVFSNKMRTFLTMLGIIIGISSVIAIVSIGNGSQAAIEKEFETFGTGSLTVSLSSYNDIETRDLLTMDDYDMLKEIEGISYVNPTYTGQSTYIKLLDPQETKSASVTGVTADAKYIDNPTMLYGRYISQNDVDMRTNVAVINDTTALKVFGHCDESVLGEKIKLKTWKGTGKYTVIGIMENTNASTETQFSDEFPETVILPISTAMRLYNNKNLNGFSILIEDLNQTDMMKERIVAALEEFHGNEDKYYIQDSSEMVDSINSILSYVTLFISFVAGISLLVGGIGVMNIMMVTVTERTREIGIRKSIGAKNKDIKIQFMTEAVILTGMGGLAGLVIGIVFAMVIGHFAGITPVLSVGAVAMAVGISMGIGIIFGVTPANKAAKLDPIEALRFE
ncbi:MAG TPA: ABC transporter permease [Candidatus Coprocola pullicola]|nr:ABC transporter permease [Candidatus Coprocola pullicola]